MVDRKAEQREMKWAEQLVVVMVAPRVEMWENQQVEKLVDQMDVILVGQ